jgi:hypothetical protein
MNVELWKYVDMARHNTEDQKILISQHRPNVETGHCVSHDTICKCKHQMSDWNAQSQHAA